MGWIRRGWTGDDLIVCTLEAQIPFPVRIHITSSKIVLPGNNTIAGMIAVDCGTAIGVN
jgi:hypothetical protein